VRVEREAAHHDPRAQNAERDREQQDLEQAALDEWKLELLEQGRPPQVTVDRVMIMGIILI
jgi:hypothetical protein